MKSKTPTKMTTENKEAIAEIRAKLGVNRLDPRRLFSVEDGVDTWIGDRANLTARTARILNDIAAATEEEYAEACAACPCLSSVQGNGDITWADLPESWRDGTALGSISPL